MSEGPKKTSYKLSIEAISSLQEVLPTQQWYKDSPKQGKLISRSVDACDALPLTEDRPVPKRDELKRDYNKRVDVWGDPYLEFEWTDAEKEAVRVCVNHYLKQGAFPATKHTKDIIRLLGIDD